MISEQASEAYSSAPSSDLSFAPRGVDLAMPVLKHREPFVPHAAENISS